MVGVACALELQRRGLSVTLVDRIAPGTQASYGNAGVLARSSLMPFNHPGLWASLPKLLKNRSTQFRYSPAFLLRKAVWSLNFLASSRRSVFEETKTALDSLIVLSTPEHRRLLAEAAASHRLRDNGWIFLYRNRSSFDAAQLSRDAYAQFGIATQELNPGDLSELEPSLARIFERGLWIKDALSVDSPGEVVRAYTELFLQSGGKLVQRKIIKLKQTSSGWSAMDDVGGELEAERVVVALGAWSPDLLSTVGLRVPMAFERGYHMHYGRNVGVNLNRPVYDVGGGYVLSPMDKGLRLTTGVELTHRDASRNTTQLQLAERLAREAFPLGDRLEEDAWMGSRPTLPDSRPVIGEAPRRPGLWLAFGHQHIGFSTGPGTALALGAMMFGERTPIDVKPFRPERFL